uniref:GH16 domain-containing protein n=1 Tax=Salix viminalis TaxID=40686 RepID=A0A6N2LXW8_SALVM
MELNKSALAIISLISLAILHHAHAQDSPQDFLNAHNTARASVGVGPMIWDDTVADFALSYINGLRRSCRMVHSRGPYGENLAWGSANLAGTAAVKMCSLAKSVRLGCAKVRCNNGGTIISCNYYPRGNIKGSAFAASQMLLFGEIATQIKVVPDHSAGIVVASCVTASDQPNRLEMDFEFLGNVSGQPYILQTNVYAYANDDREERIYLWLDPTKALHTHSVLWNVDDITEKTEITHGQQFSSLILELQTPSLCLKCSNLTLGSGFVKMSASCSYVLQKSNFTSSC